MRRGAILVALVKLSLFIAFLQSNLKFRVSSYYLDYLSHKISLFKSSHTDLNSTIANLSPINCRRGTHQVGTEREPENYFRQSLFGNPLVSLPLPFLLSFCCSFYSFSISINLSYPIRSDILECRRVGCRRFLQFQDIPTFKRIGLHSLLELFQFFFFR